VPLSPFIGNSMHTYRAPVDIHVVYRFSQTGEARRSPPSECAVSTPPRFARARARAHGACYIGALDRASAHTRDFSHAVAHRCTVTYTGCPPCPLPSRQVSTNRSIVLYSIDRSKRRELFRGSSISKGKGSKLTLLFYVSDASEERV